METALDAGITEAEFWSMTLAEIMRAMEAARRRELIEQQRRAVYDYRLADLIGHSIGRIYSKGAMMPELSEVYPNLFDNDQMAEAKAEREAERFAAQFRAFAAAHNKRMEVENDGKQQIASSD